MGKRRKHKLTAKNADKYELYQRSVQVPSAEVRFFDRAYRHAYGSRPTLLREDFCGTAAICCKWVRSRAERRAHGVDLDPEPLRWGSEHNVAKLPAEAQKRLRLYQRDVREIKGQKADVIAAENFSYFIFRSREELLKYFVAARRSLARKGVLVLDVMGGSEVLQENRKEKRKVKGFHYIWEQARFDPITNHCRFHIHFKFKNGSRLRRAFSYDWRLWSIPEIEELLAEAGFRESAVYWEGTDADGEGNGVYRRRKHAPSDPAWIAYVVGIK